jgi:hypothetical protein
MKTRRFVSLLFLTLLATACGSDRTESKTVLAGNLTEGTAVGDRTSLSCRALMESDLTGSDGSVVPRGLEGKLGAGANDVSVSFESTSTMRLLSQAGFAAGTTAGPEFSIVENTAEHVVATYSDGRSFNSFTINKANGFAIWAKTRPTFPGYGAPTGSQTYLSCQ